MPAFITHLIISRDIEEKNNNQNFFSLGSLGPDLPYYRNVFGAAISAFFEERFNSKSAGFYLGHGDYFHSRTPNIFPLKLLETIRKDDLLKNDENKKGKFAFACGYLTHMAADLIFHPYVNSLAGSYYLFVENAIKHRNIEICLDRFIFENKFPENKLFDQDFLSWVKINTEPEKDEIRPPDPLLGDTEKIKFVENTMSWFRSFIQRAFLESHSIIIDGDDIEKWVSGFFSVLKNYKSIGPYRDIAKRNSTLDKLYRDLKIQFERNKVLDLYSSTIDLSKKFIKEAEAFINSPKISSVERDEFLIQVPDNDLTAPLPAT